MTDTQIKVIKACERVMQKQSRLIRRMAKRLPLLECVKILEDVDAVDNELSELRKLLRQQKGEAK